MDSTRLAELDEQEVSLLGEQIESAIQKAHNASDALDKIAGLQSSASEIDRLFENRHIQGRFVEGANAYDLFSMANVIIDRNISNLILEDNSSNTIYSNNALAIGTSVGGVGSDYMIMRLPFNQSFDMTDTDIVNLNILVTEAIVADGARSKNFGYIKFYLTSADGTAGLGCIVLSENISLQRGRNNVQIHKSQFTISSGTGFDWSSVGGCKIVFQSSSGHIGVPIYLDSLSFLQSNNKPVPMCITLDDGTPDGFEMSKIASQYGLVTTHFIIPWYITDGTNGYMSISQLKELQSMGHAISMHETGINSLAWEPEKLATTLQWFKENGFNKRGEHLYVAYPNGGYSRRTMPILEELGILGSRSTANKSRSDSEEVEATKGVEGAPGDASEPYLMGIAEIQQITGSKAQLETYFKESIDASIERKLAYISTHHFFTELDKTTNDPEVGKTAWINTMKHIRQKVDAGELEVLTFPDFVERYHK